ncbi:IS66 family insertion sequence element accessory protein TnpB [Sphingomonas hankookensis]|uniref:IS66 family insertion sequence element accessory protein TnpB n=1 Tax=Sphingomonas hankookensis TaxID=563996 RepID=UPI003B6725C9
MRKGFDGLAALVQQRLRQDPFGGAVYAFRAGAVIWSSCCGGRSSQGSGDAQHRWKAAQGGQGLVLHAKRRECQEFRVRAGIKGKKETRYVPTQRACDTERVTGSVAGRR